MKPLLIFLNKGEYGKVINNLYSKVFSSFLQGSRNSSFQDHSTERKHFGITGAENDIHSSYILPGDAVSAG